MNAAHIRTTPTQTALVCDVLLLWYIGVAHRAATQAA
jgi:hypothetical protein